MAAPRRAARRGARRALLLASAARPAAPAAYGGARCVRGLVRRSVGAAREVRVRRRFAARARACACVRDRGAAAQRAASSPAGRPALVWRSMLPLRTLLRVLEAAGWHVWGCDRSGGQEGAYEELVGELVISYTAFGQGRVITTPRGSQPRPAELPAHQGLARAPARVKELDTATNIGTSLHHCCARPQITRKGTKTQLLPSRGPSRRESASPVRPLPGYSSHARASPQRPAGALAPAAAARFARKRTSPAHPAAPRAPPRRRRGRHGASRGGAQVPCGPQGVPLRVAGQRAAGAADS